MFVSIQSRAALPGGFIKQFSAAQLILIFLFCPVASHAGPGRKANGSQLNQAEAQPQRHRATGGPLTREEAQRLAMLDAEVFDQHGRKVRFYSDLIKDKVVAINFIFTSCTSICPMQMAAFANLQAALGDRLGKEVHLISVSTDPVVDTRDRLNALAHQFKVKPGWTLVTGGEAEIARIVRVLTGAALGRGEHVPILLAGDGRSWVTEYSLAEPTRYIKLFDEILKRHRAGAPEEKRLTQGSN